MKTTTNEEIYQKLSDKIMFLELEPGKQLTETEGAQMFGVSRTPIREVYRRLENDGLIEIIPQVGTFISLIDINEISDILFIRENLELKVFSLVENISDSQMLKLQINLMNQKKVLEEEEDGRTMAQKMLALDNELHAYIFQLANKSSIWNKISETKPHYNRLRLLSNLKEKEELETLYNQHLEIVDCLAKKDYTKLESVYKEHLYAGIRELPAIVWKYQSFFKVG